MQKQRNVFYLKNPVFCLIAFFWVILALSSPISVISVFDTGNSFINLLLTIANSFVGQRPIDMISEVFLMILIINSIVKNNAGISFSTIALAFVLSLCLILCSALTLSDSLAFMYTDIYHFVLFSFCLAGYTILLSLLLTLTEHFMLSHRFTEVSVSQPSTTPPTLLFLIGFLSIFLCWLIWIVAYFPGTLSLDALSQLSQALGRTTVSNHQPPLSSFLMGAMIRLGEITGSRNNGVFFYVIFQSLLGAFTFSMGITKLYERGLKKSICIGFIIFFAVCPIWGCFSQYFEKDFIYTIILTLNMLLCTEVIFGKALDVKNIIFIFFTGIFSCLLRNNGIYIIIPLYVAMSVLTMKRQKRTSVSMAGITLGTICLFIIITKAVYPSIGIDSDSKREMLSIPLQQTARYVKEYGDEVTADEMHSINMLLDYDSIADNYNPRISDPIKDGYTGDDAHLPQYFATWLKMFFKHPRVYIEAFLNQCYGYLAPVEECSPCPGVTLYPEEAKSFRLSREPAGTLGSILETWRLTCYIWPIIQFLFMPGFYVWMIVVTAFFVFKKKNNKAALMLPMLISALMTFLVCIASPLACEIRYALPIAAYCPFVIGYGMLSAVKS